MEHEFYLALAFLAGIESFTAKGNRFEDFNLQCSCNECHSEFARGYSSELNYKMSMDNWMNFG